MDMGSLTSAPYSHGWERPHSQSANTIDLPEARMPSRIASNLSLMPCRQLYEAGKQQPDSWMHVMVGQTADAAFMAGHVCRAFMIRALRWLRVQQQECGDYATQKLKLTPTELISCSIQASDKLSCSSNTISAACTLHMGSHKKLSEQIKAIASSVGDVPLISPSKRESSAAVVFAQGACRSRHVPL